MGQIQLLWAGDVKGHLLCVGHYAGALQMQSRLLLPKTLTEAWYSSHPFYRWGNWDSNRSWSHRESEWRTGIQLQAYPEYFPAEQSFPDCRVKLFEESKITLEGLELKWLK